MVTIKTYFYILVKFMLLLCHLELICIDGNLMLKL